MAGIAAFQAQRMLNVALKNTASIASPATLAMGLSLGVPTSLSMSEVGTGSGYTAKTVTFSSVAASGTVASNAAALTFGPFSSIATIQGCFIKNTLATGGTMFFYGTMNSTVLLAAGDTITFAPAALTVSLA